MFDLLSETRNLKHKHNSGHIGKKNHKMCYEEESFKVDNDQYQKFVKKLIYLAHTMSHLTYAISVLSQFMHDPRGVYL